MKNRRLVGLALACATFVSCGASDGPTAPFPADFTVEPARYSCGSWSPGPPQKNRALLDVYFGRRSAEDPEDRPRLASIAEVVTLGGNVVHEYHLPMARVILDVDRVPELRAAFVRGVSDSRIVSARVTIGIDTPISSDDLEFLDEVGAREITEYSFGAVAWVPDGAISQMRSRSGVRYVAVVGVFCLGAAA